MTAPTTVFALRVALAIQWAVMNQYCQISFKFKVVGKAAAMSYLLLFLQWQGSKGEKGEEIV